jgi:DNA-binding LacI/PurR family transcriptional regulator
MPDNDPATRRPTLAHVAEAAGVSVALVSIVMRGAKGASDATREKVRAAARELGYRPDSRARSLRSRRTRLLGVTFNISQPFHAEIVDAVYSAAQTEGYEVVLSAVGPNREEQRAVESLLDSGCEALIMVSPESSASALQSYVRQVPVVSMLREVDGVDVVRTDDASGIFQAVEHLVQLGHRRISHVDGGTAVSADVRRQAYEEAMRSRRLSQFIRIVPGGLDEQDGANAVPLLLDGADPHGRPTAVVVFNDHSALGVIDALVRRGITVPGDISVIGYDNSQFARLAHISMTSVSQNVQALACSAVACAVARLSAEEPTRLLHTPSLKVRTSTAQPRQHE